MSAKATRAKKEIAWALELKAGRGASSASPRGVEPLVTVAEGTRSDIIRINPLDDEVGEFPDVLRRLDLTHAKFDAEGFFNGDDQRDM